MHIPSLYIHDYFLESIRMTWLIQVEVLIEVLSVYAADFPSFIYFFSTLLPLSISVCGSVISVLHTSLTVFFNPTLLSFYSGVLLLIGCDRLYPFGSIKFSLVVPVWGVLTLYELVMKDSLVVAVIYYGSGGEWCCEGFSQVASRLPACLRATRYAFTALQGYFREPNSSARFEKLWFCVAKEVP